MTVSRDHAPTDRAVTSGQPHTPGPWETRGPTRVYGNLQRDQNSTADLVATTVNAADASLIAAAPEMYEALQAVWWFIERHDDTPAHLAETVLRALHKAEGRS